MPSVGANAAFALLTNRLGARIDPYKACNFLVEIDGLLVGGFSECRGLSAQTETYEYREGGVNGYAHQFAGPTKYPSLELKHGLTPIDTLWAWHQDVAAGIVTRRSGSIYLLDERKLPVMWWDFRDAYPIRWSGPELSASSTTVAVESVEFAHRGLSRPQAAGRALGLAAAVAGKLRF